MPLRFRRTFKLFPGLRLNISKKGMSTSLGGPGASLNLGKRGPRATIGIPGTGLSYTAPIAKLFSSSGGSDYHGPSIPAIPPSSNPPVIEGSADPPAKKPAPKWLLVLVGLIILCCGCFFGTVFIQAVLDGSGINATATQTITQIPTSLATMTPITRQEEIPSTLPTHTSTIDPSIPWPSTPTFMANVTLAPTQVKAVTDIPLNTVTPMPIPTQGEICTCSADLYNCSNFSSHTMAQACFAYCQTQGAGDVHQLDSDNDGQVCESLP